MWDQPNLVWLLSIVAGALVVAIALVGFLSWRLSRSFVEGDEHFTQSVCLRQRKRKSDAAPGRGCKLLLARRADVVAHAPPMPKQNRRRKGAGLCD
jgi:hypothetical protein